MSEHPHVPRELSPGLVNLEGNYYHLTTELIRSLL